MILSGDTSIQAGANHFGGFFPLAKNLPGFSYAGPLFYGHFTMLPAHGHRASFPAMLGFIITLSRIRKIHSPCQSLAIVPWHPVRGVGGQLPCVTLQFDQVVEGVNAT